MTDRTMLAQVLIAGMVLAFGTFAAWRRHNTYERRDDRRRKKEIDSYLKIMADKQAATNAQATQDR